MKALYFKRNYNEYRAIWVFDNGDYRIRPQMTNSTSKRHHNVNEYIARITQNGWVEATFEEYLHIKYYVDKTV